MKQQTIIERVQEIERLAEHFHLLETKILGVLNFRDFFQVLQAQLGEIFNVPHVWFSLIRDEAAAAPILRAALDSKLNDYLNLIDSEQFSVLLSRPEKPLLENENLAAYHALLPTQNRFYFKSLAMVPVRQNGKLVGSLNLADSTAARFHPGYNPVHLERLAVKVSLFLSNVSAHESLKYLAFHDPLTDLYNRRALEQTLEREFARAHRYCSHLSLVFIDLDLFKSINDSYGHDCGDALLKHLAGTMVDMSRQSDMVTRLAGDEFVLLLPETMLDQAELIMQRIVERLCRQPLDWQGEEIRAQISFGIASVMEDHVDSAEALLKLADQRLYNKKQAHRRNG